MENYGTCIGVTSIALSTTSPSGLKPLPGDTLAANSMLIRVEGANARFRMDGQLATTGTTGGMQILSTDLPLWIEGKGNLLNFSAIGLTGSPVLTILYFGVMR